MSDFAMVMRGGGFNPWKSEIEAASKEANPDGCTSQLFNLYILCLSGAETVEWDAFLQAMQSYKGAHPDEKTAISDAFKVYFEIEFVIFCLQFFDKNGDGFISVQEFKAVVCIPTYIHIKYRYRLAIVCVQYMLIHNNVYSQCTSQGEKMTEEEVEDMLKGADIDKDGRLNLQEFFKLMSER